MYQEPIVIVEGAEAKEVKTTPNKKIVKAKIKAITAGLARILLIKSKGSRSECTLKKVNTPITTQPPQKPLRTPRN
jgi:hypothetical protein